MATMQPNILILWGDDIGTRNVSHSSRGMMSYRTRTSTASPTKGRRLQTSMVSRAAPLAALPSSRDRTLFVPA